MHVFFFLVDGQVKIMRYHISWWNHVYDSWIHEEMKIFGMNGLKTSKNGIITKLSEKYKNVKSWERG